MMQDTAEAEMYSRTRGAADAAQVGGADAGPAASPVGEDPAARRLLRNALLVSLRRVTVA